MNRQEQGQHQFLSRSRLAPINIMQVTDSLLAGGLERVAVTLANRLPPNRFRAHLCTTRLGGPLVEVIEPQVLRLELHRRGFLDLRAIRRMAHYVQQHDIRLLHAHGTTLFICALVSCCRPRPRILWHDHFGRYAIEERPLWLYRPAARFVSGVISVNEPLADWARTRLRVPAERVWYVPNCAAAPKTNGHSLILPGVPGSRIVCVANLRPEKGHRCLLQAMHRVVELVPAAHLILVGRADDLTCLAQLQREMGTGLKNHVTWLGPRTDVGSILKCCDVAVLSSLSEGLPLALIEYGLAGLPAVATHTGQCAEVLDEGRAGRLAPPGEPKPLAEALVSLLQQPEARRRLGRAFQVRVQLAYSAEQVMPRICEVYERVLQ